MGKENVVYIDVGVESPAFRHLLGVLGHIPRGEEGSLFCGYTMPLLCF